MGLNNFHIHVDAVKLPKEMEKSLLHELEFEETNFCGHPAGRKHFEPDHHLTRKTKDSVQFQSLFEETKALLSSKEEFVGYLEGEHIATDKEIPNAPFVDINLPVSLELGPLKQGSFRDTEIHITMCKDRSDSRLIEKLLNSGLFGAYIPKGYGTAVVLTVQGDKLSIGKLFPVLHDYLVQSGGVVEGSIKEERVAKWWLSHPSVQLPPVVNLITHTQ